jgi:hypothetical protein
MYIQGVYSPALIGTLLIHTPTSKEVGPIYTTTQGNNAYRVCWGIYSTSFQQAFKSLLLSTFCRNFFPFPFFCRDYVWETLHNTLHLFRFGGEIGRRADWSVEWILYSNHIRVFCTKVKEREKKKKTNYGKETFLFLFFYSNPFRFSGHVDLCWTSVSGPAVWLVTQHTHTILCVCYCIAVLVFLPLKLPDR